MVPRTLFLILTHVFLLLAAAEGGTADVKEEQTTEKGEVDLNTDLDSSDPQSSSKAIPIQGTPDNTYQRILLLWLLSKYFLTTTPPPTTDPPIASPVLDHPVTVGQCGMRQRIVGGVESTPGAWPWVVIVSDNVGDPYCGGTLISKRHVLTAAHCVIGQVSDDSYPLWVTLREHNLMDDSDGPTQTLRVASTLYNQQYSAITDRNDIAVLVLEGTIDQRLNVVPVCLPYPDYSVQEGTKLVTMGWGRTEEQGDLSSVLREVEVTVLPAETCTSAYSHFSPETMICAGDEEGGKDSCQGDSGGPLTQKVKDTGAWTVVGVVSYGRGCGRPDNPGVYTKVASYLPWIAEVMARYP